MSQLSNVQILYIKRIRSTTIRIKPDGSIRVTAPYGLPESEVYRFLDKKSDWISKRINLFKKIHDQQKYNFNDGEMLPYLGRFLKLNVIDQIEYNSRTNIVEFRDDQLIVSVPVENRNKDFVKSALINWYQSNAFEEIKNQVMNYSALLGLVPQSISIKNYKSRWGACTAKGELIFNWQIVAMSQNHFNYVVAHEVCHLKEMNHSARFYSLLSKLGFEKNSIHAEMRHLRNLF